MASKTTVTASVNTQPAIEAVKRLKAELANLQKQYDSFSAIEKTTSAEAKQVRRAMDAVTEAIKYNQAEMFKVDRVVRDLSNSSLRQLQSALRAAKKDLSGLSENSSRLAELQENIRKIEQQIKLVKNETANIARGMKDLRGQTDAWLSSAISKQEQLVAATKKGSNEYMQQMSILRQLKNEESVRNTAMVASKGQAALRQDYGSMNANQLAQTRQSLTAYRDIIKPGQTAELAKVNAALAEIDKKTEAIRGKAQQIGQSLYSIASNQQQLRTQTDAWLSSAINKQKQLVASIQATDAAYNQERITLIRLNEEQNRRIVEQGQRAMQTTHIPAATEESLLASKSAVTAYRSLVPANDVETLNKINEFLREVDKHLEIIHGKGQQIAPTMQQIETEAKKLAADVAKIDFKKATPNELKAKLDEINRLLGQLGTNSPLRKDLVTQANRLKQALDGVDREGVNVQRVLKNLKSTPLKDLQAAADKLKREMAEVQRNTKQYVATRRDLQRVTREIQNATGAVKQHGSAWRQTFQVISAYMGVTTLIGKVQQMVRGLINLNLQLSDQMASIRKTTGWTAEDVEILSSRLSDIDTRTSINDLTNLAYFGAKAGLGQYGIEGLASFVRAADQINSVLKEDLDQEAILALAKMSEVMHLIPQMGSIEKAMLASGSAIYTLASTSVASADKIVEFAQRLMSVASTSHVTTDELLALGSVTSATGLSAEVAATAFIKVMTAITDHPRDIARAVKIDESELETLVTTGHTMDAIVLAFEKMRNLQPWERNRAMRAFGSDGARLNAVLTTMSDNVDTLRQHLDTSRKAFTEATAATRDYRISQQTAAAYMERASNLWKKAFVSTEGVDNVNGLAKAWYNFSRMLTESEGYMWSIKAVLGLLLFAVKTLIAVLPALLAYFMFRGVVAAIGAVVGAVRTLTISTQAATAAQISLNAAQRANAIGLLISLFAALVSWIWTYAGALSDLERSQRELDKCMAETTLQIERERNAIRDVIRALEDENKTEEERQRILQKFNHDYQPYLSKLGLEITSANSLRDAYAAINEELSKKLWYQSKENARQRVLQPLMEAQDEALASAYNNIRKESGFSGVDYAMLVDIVSEAIPDNVEEMTSVQIQNLAQDKADELLRRSIIANGGTINGRSGRYDLVNGQEIRVYGYDYTTEDGKTDWDRATTTVRTHLRDFMQATYDLKKGVQDMESRYAALIDDYTPPEPETDSVNIEAAPPSANEQNEQRRQWRDELRDQKDQVKAMMDNIENFYKRQSDATKAIATQEHWDAALLDTRLDVIKNRMDTALNAARQSLALGNEAWANFKQTMENDLIEQADEFGFNQSQMLLDNLLQANPALIRERLQRLSTALGLQFRSVLDEVWLNATRNEGNIINRAWQQLQARNKAILEGNYTGRVDSQFRQSMYSNFGFFSLSPEQEALANDSTRMDEAAEMIRSRNSEIDALLETTRSRIVDLYAIGEEAVSTDEGRIRLLEILFGENWSQEQSQLKDMFELTGDDLKLFYNQLLKYYDDYTEAHKKQIERQRKNLDFLWNNSQTKRDFDQRMRDDEAYRAGILQYTNADEAARRPVNGVFGNESFRSEFGVDPEIELLKTKMELEQERMEQLRANNAEQELIAEQQARIYEAQMVYVKKLADSIKKQMQDIYGMASPVEEFGTAMGEAFATMTEDADKGREAVKEAIGDMIKAFMKQTVQMTQEYIKRRLMQTVHDKLMSKQIVKSGQMQINQERDNQTSLLNIQQQGGEARIDLTQAVEGGAQQIQQEIGQETSDMVAQQTTENVQTQVAETQAGTVLGIAEGSAKTIGKLGWWGIPLIAVITAALNGLLAFAMSRVSSLFGGKNKSNTSTPTASTKLVSGMLTYDRGNVQAFRGVEDGKSYPVVGNDGKVYAATDAGELTTGLVRDPITTIVNGQPALVAEKGPEIVIGRETTAEIMTYHPELLRKIVDIDTYRSGRTYRAYDSGNVAELADVASSNIGILPEDVAALRSTITALASVVSDLQRKGIKATINKWGKDGLVETVEDGRRFMQRNSGGSMWK